VTIALVVVVVVVAGGGGLLVATSGGGSPKTSRAVGGSSPARLAPTATAATLAAPLTGVVDASGASLARPALEVKIENTPDARPQAGLDQADVVYEEVVEGGITRFVAIFNSTVPETVGPIRSVRAMDPTTIWPLGGVFAYSGGAQVNVDAINAAPVHSVDESAAGPAMFRSTTRPAPHNLYGDTAALFALGAEPVPPPHLFQYLPAGVGVSGLPATRVRVGFSNGYDTTYTWSPTTRTWARFYGQEVALAASGAPLAPTNVIVQATLYAGDGEGDTIGAGQAWVFSDGTVRTGHWVRTSREQVTRYVDDAGFPILLAPGRTWIELLPTGDPLDIT
jgi:hypothetical protein